MYLLLMHTWKERIFVYHMFVGKYVWKYSVRHDTLNYMGIWCTAEYYTATVRGLFKFVLHFVLMFLTLSLTTFVIYIYQKGRGGGWFIFSNLNQFQHSWYRYIGDGPNLKWIQSLTVVLPFNNELWILKEIS